MKEIIEDIPTKFFISDDGLYKSTKRDKVVKYEKAMGVAAPKKVIEITLKDKHEKTGKKVWFLYNIQSEADFIKMINEEVPNRKFLTSKINFIERYKTHPIPEDKIGIWGFFITEWYSDAMEKYYTDLVVWPIRVLRETLEQECENYKDYVQNYTNAITILNKI